MALGPGQTVREYVVLGSVRRAQGRGDLFAARHRLLQTACAIREVPATLLVEGATRDWVMHEARVFAELDHPGVARVIDCFEDAGRTFLVYDFLEGPTLEGILSHGPLPPSAAVRVAFSVGEALQAAHLHRWRLGEALETGIPHGDLRAEHVVVGRRGRIKLLDFSPLGSVRDPAADRRSLGRLLAQMLMGTLTWNDEDYVHRLPPLPVSLRELLDMLVLPGGGSSAGAPPEFEQFLPLLDDLRAAYEGGGLVPRFSLEMTGSVAVPLALASNPARKRLFVGDAARRTVARFTFAGVLEERVDKLPHRAAGLAWMTGYGLYVAGPDPGQLALLGTAGPQPLTVTGAAPSAGEAPADDAALVGAARVDQDTLALADPAGRRVLLVDPQGQVKGVLGEGAGDLQRPVGVAAFRNEVAVSDPERNAVVFFDRGGAVLRWRDGAEESLVEPCGCDYDPLGNFYVADRGAGKVVVFQPDGSRVEFDNLAVSEAVASSPSDVHVTEGGCLIVVADPKARLVLLFDNFFFLSAVEASGRCTECGFHNPVGAGRCLVCADLERAYPVPSTAAAAAAADAQQGEEQAELEQEVMLKSLIEAGEAARALAPLKRRFAANPDDPEAFALLAEAYRACGEWEPLSVVELIRRAERDPRAAHLLGSLFVGLGAVGLARRWLDLYVQRAGDDDDAREVRSALERLEGAPPPRSTELSRFLLRLAGLVEVENRTDDAVACYSGQLELDPDDYGTRTSLARLLVRERRLDEAEPLFRWMVERNPYDVEALEFLSCATNRRKAFAETREQLSAFFADPQIGDRLIAGHGKLRHNLGVALRELGDQKAADRELARAKRLGFSPLAPEKVKALYDRSKDGDFAKAVQLGEELLLEFELFKWPDADISRNILWKMAHGYERLGDLDRAVRCYRTFSQRYPSHPAALQALTAVAELARKRSAKP